MGCTKLLQKGVPLPDIMHLVGWKDFDSVRRYMGLLTHSRIGGGRRGGLGLNFRLYVGDPTFDNVFFFGTCIKGSVGQV
jgi:hypothetical protein